MRKKTTSKRAISIARGGEEYNVPFKNGMTIEDAFEKADITLASGEEIFVQAEEASLEDVLDAGDLVQIVGKKEGGR